jgi:hypothetical protein
MKLIYVAGPYRSKDGRQGVMENIFNAHMAASQLWALGYAALCPHKATQDLDRFASEQTFLAGTLEMALRCDAVVVLPGFENSEGTKGEISAAEAKGIPVFYLALNEAGLDAGRADEPYLFPPEFTLWAQPNTSLQGK